MYIIARVISSFRFKRRTVLGHIGPVYMEVGNGHPTHHVNLIKLPVKSAIIWTSGLPHLPGVPPPPSCKQALRHFFLHIGSVSFILFFFNCHLSLTEKFSLDSANWQQPNFCVQKDGLTVHYLINCGLMYRYRPTGFTHWRFVLLFSKIIENRFYVRFSSF